MTTRREIFVGGAKSLAILGVASLTSAFRLEAMPKSYIPGHLESDDPTWELLGNIGFPPAARGSLEQASFPEALTRIAGKPFTVRGFIMQLSAERRFNHFVVTRRNSNCGFCPPNGVGEAVEVFMPRSLAYTPHEYEVRGTLVLFNRPTTGLFYRLTNAVATRT